MVVDILGTLPAVKEKFHWKICMNSFTVALAVSKEQNVFLSTWHRDFLNNCITYKHAESVTKWLATYIMSPLKSEQEKRKKL